MFCVLEHVTFHLGVQAAVRLRFGRRYAIIKYNYLSMVLIFSSFGKLLSILIIVWNYHDMQHSWMLNAFALFSIAQALCVFLEASIQSVLPILMAGVLCKCIVQALYIGLLGNLLPFHLISI